MHLGKNKLHINFSFNTFDHDMRYHIIFQVDLGFGFKWGFFGR